MKLAAIILSALAACTGATHAAAAALAVPTIQPASNQARLSLIAEHQELIPGQTNYIAARFQIDAGWHIYWPGLNDTGFPPSLNLTMPAGFTVGETLWPAPKRYTSPGEILDYIYEKDVLLIIPVEVPGDAGGDPITIRLESRWLVCKEACIPGEGAAELTIPVGKRGEKPRPGEHAKLFTAVRERLPKPFADSRGTVRATASGGELRIEAPGAESVAFFPAAESTGLARPIEQGAAKGGILNARLADAAPGAAVQGVVEVVLPGKKPVYYTLKIRAD